MTQFINCIYLPHVEKMFDASYIAYVLEKHKLARVSSVRLIPYKQTNDTRNNLYNQAYVQIEDWIHGAPANAFIRALQDDRVETRFVHRDDFWWAVSINGPSRPVARPASRPSARPVARPLTHH